MLHNYGERDGWQQLFFFKFMSGKYTIKQFNEFRDAFLKVKEPKDLAYLLKINVNKLASLTKKDGYFKNVIIMVRGKGE